MVRGWMAACVLAAVVGGPGCGGSPAALTGTTAATFAIGMPIALPDLGQAARCQQHDHADVAGHSFDGLREARRALITC